MVMEQRRINQTWSLAVGHTERNAVPRREGKVHLHVLNVLYSVANRAGVTARKSKGPAFDMTLLGLMKSVRRGFFAMWSWFKAVVFSFIFLFCLCTV